MIIEKNIFAMQASRFFLVIIMLVILLSPSGLMSFPSLYFNLIEYIIIKWLVQVSHFGLWILHIHRDIIRILCSDDIIDNMYWNWSFFKNHFLQFLLEFIILHVILLHVFHLLPEVRYKISSICCEQILLILIQFYNIQL